MFGLAIIKTRRAAIKRLVLSNVVNKEIHVLPMLSIWSRSGVTASFYACHAPSIHGTLAVIRLGEQNKTAGTLILLNMVWFAAGVEMTSLVGRITVITLDCFAQFEIILLFSTVPIYLRLTYPGLPLSVNLTCLWLPGFTEQFEMRVA